MEHWLLIAWVLVSPLLSALVVARADRLRRLVARYLGLSLTLGWGGLLLMLLMAMLPLSLASGAWLLIGGALSGLAVWTRNDDDDDDDDDDESPDWGDFERSLQRYIDEREIVPR